MIPQPHDVVGEPEPDSGLKMVRADLSLPFAHVDVSKTSALRPANRCAGQLEVLLPVEDKGVAGKGCG